MTAATVTGYRPGDVVTATLDDTAGQTVTAELRVLEADRLGCGCQRLVADRPGPVPIPAGVHLLTGCHLGHESQVA